MPRRFDSELAVETLLRSWAGHGLRVGGLVGLLFAGGLLVSAWSAGPGQREAVDALGGLTARGEGVVEETWWRLDFDPAALGERGTNWQGRTRPELCARLRFEDADGATRPAVFCRRFAELFGLYMLRDWAEVAPGVPPPCLGDDGFPVLEVDFSPRAYGWLTGQPPSSLVTSLRRRPGVDLPVLNARNRFDEEVDLELDKPIEVLARTWSEEHAKTERAARAPLEIAYDPAAPSRAVPSSLLGQSRADHRSTEDFTNPLLMAAGLFWTMAWVILFIGATPRWWTALLALVVAGATLYTLPAWADRADDLVRKVWEPGADVVELLSSELVTPPPTVELHPPTFDGEPGDVRKVWSVETSRYADLLDRLDLQPPSEPVSEGELIDRFVERAHERLPDSELRDDLLYGHDQLYGLE